MISYLVTSSSILPTWGCGSSCKRITKVMRGYIHTYESWHHVFFRISYPTGHTPSRNSVPLAVPANNSRRNQQVTTQQPQHPYPSLTAHTRHLVRNLNMAKVIIWCSPIFSHEHMLFALKCIPFVIIHTHMSSTTNAHRLCWGLEVFSCCSQLLWPSNRNCVDRPGPGTPMGNQGILVTQVHRFTDPKTFLARPPTDYINVQCTQQRWHKLNKNKSKLFIIY